MGILFFLTTTLNIHYPKAKLLSRKMYKVGCICHSHFPRMHCKAGDEKQCPEDLVDCLCEGKEHTLMVDAVFNRECNGCDAWKLLLRSPPRYHLNCACRCSFSQDGPRALQTQEENWIWNTELWSMAVLVFFCKKKILITVPECATQQPGRDCLLKATWVWLRMDDIWSLKVENVAFLFCHLAIPELSRSLSVAVGLGSTVFAAWTLQRTQEAAG